MPIRNNPTLGQTICSECGEVATVHQQSRGSGGYLYTRGCNCKYRNSTGSIFQTRLWNETEWLPDAEPEMPLNLEDDCSTDEADAGNGPRAETGESHNENASSKRWIVAGLSILGCVALFVLSGGRRVS